MAVSRDSSDSSIGGDLKGATSDLPALLREYAERTTGYIYADEIAVLREAADEIERLRERLRPITPMEGDAV